MEIENAPKNSIVYECKQCHYKTYHKGDYTKHISTLKHKKNDNLGILEINGNEKSPSQSKLPVTISNDAPIESAILNVHGYKFTCELCNYNTNNKRDLNRHIITLKHIQNSNNRVEQKINICAKCNKQFTTTSGLWKHRKKCEIIETIININNNISVELIKEVIKESKELQNVLLEQNKELQNKLFEKDNILIEQNNKLIELAKNPSVVNNNNTTNNTNNNQFNLQFYLNETCKDAMNIVDFVNSLTVTTEDFETTGKLGFVEGISRIFIKALKHMEKEKLPIHCTDLKRETVYIKDKNIWEKENDDKRKLKWTIDRIAQLNLNQNQSWLEKYPICKENNTKENEEFTAMALVALGGRGEEEDDKFRQKIMRNVLKEVVMDKQCKVLN